jgi:hypothetical protein
VKEPLATTEKKAAWAPTTSLEDIDNRNISCPCQDLKLDHSDHTSIFLKT